MRRTWILLSVAALLLAAGPARADVVLYDAALNNLPTDQGWIFGNTGTAATQSVSGGILTLDSTANNDTSAGYSTRLPTGSGAPQALNPPLDRLTGYTISFRVRVVSESHASNNRAGFSIIAIGNDLQGIELGFWTDEIWAQAVGFTHAEGVEADTTSSLVTYDLSVFGSAYTLYAGGSSVLTGSLRDYSGSIVPVYRTPNLIFLGDDTTSAQARTEIARVSYAAQPVPEPSAFLLTLAGVGAIAVIRRKKRMGHG